MEAAVGAANWLLGKVLTKLSDDLVATFVASSELGHNFHSVKRQLLHTQGLLHAAQGRDMSSNPDPGLQGLLAELSKKADDAEDLLDEVHYFMIQDVLDGTSEATEQESTVLRAHARDGRHAIRHAVGNCLQCFSSCSPTKDDDCAATSSNPHNAAMSSDGRPVEKLPFNRVDMSKRIKSVIEEMNSICAFVSDLLKIATHSSTVPSRYVTLKRPPTGSLVAQDKLYGRGVILEKTVNMLTSSTYHSETLSVLPFVGPGGIGKTKFTQHLYNDKRIKQHFSVMVWVCISTDFDVIKLTRQIHSCIPAIEKEENNIANETSNLDQLQRSIAKRLKSKRFLIVLDDIWKCNSKGDWENLLAPLRKGESKGSMVLVTTRFPYIAHMVKTIDQVELHGLEPKDFFPFFEACIFGHNKPPKHYEDDLVDVASDIAKRLKGSPLAASTVGRLLRKNLSREYWMGVLEKDEWQHTKNDDDIMPSLKISYEYLPFYLKKCFSYFSLFPEDYIFNNLEIKWFWTAIGITESSCQNKKNYLEDLVDNGFLMEKGADKFGQYYVMHDLLHELCQNISSLECVNISSLSFRAHDIPQSIRHLSITIENIYDESFEEEMGRLKSRIDIQNLRTLMIFKLYDARTANVLKNTFEEIKGLRVLFYVMNTQKSLPKNFSNLVHLQYLKISTYYRKEMALPSSLSRFYHLKFLDLTNWRGREKIPEDFNRLVNLRHFYSSEELHSSIPEVGKMKCLQELRKFNVKKESSGFELRELGELTELGGELTICNLETVRSKEEASDAKLKNKRNLKELTLVWGKTHQTMDDDILDGLHPHHNLKMLGIINPGVSPCPSWLCGDITTKRLESFHLQGVSWGTLPPFEQLPHLTELILKNITGMRMFGPGFGGVTERSFMHLKRIVFEDMPQLVKWVGGPNTHLFSKLESIKLDLCPFLSSFPFLECSDPFTNLRSLYIDNCPKLLQFPPMPHTSTLTYVHVEDNDTIKLFYDEKELCIEGYTSALAFHNMDKVEVMQITGVSHIPLSDPRKLKSLRSLHFFECDDWLLAEMDETVLFRSVQDLQLVNLCITGELFSKVLKCFPDLSKISITGCESLDLLPVEDGGLSDLTMLQSFGAFLCPKLFSLWPMGELGGGAHAIKPFPTSLRKLKIYSEASMQSMGLLSNLTSLTHLRLDNLKKLSMDGFNPLMIVNLKKLSLYLDQENISVAGDLLSEIGRSNLLLAGSFQLEELKADSISAVLAAPISSHLAATLHTLHFENDQQATNFTEEQERGLQLLTSLRHLRFASCRNLQSLPQGLRCLSSLKRLDLIDCKEILSLPPKEGLPTSLETLELLSCSPALTEQAKKMEGADPWFSVRVLTSVFSLVEECGASCIRNSGSHIPVNLPEQTGSN